MDLNLETAVGINRMIWLLSEYTQKGGRPFAGYVPTSFTSWVLMRTLYKQRPPHAIVERRQDSVRILSCMSCRDDISHSSTDRRLQEMHGLVPRYLQASLCLRTCGAFRWDTPWLFSSRLSITPRPLFVLSFRLHRHIVYKTSKAGATSSPTAHPNYRESIPDDGQKVVIFSRVQGTV